MTIRQATPEDFDAIYSLVKTAFQTAKVSDGGEQDFVLKLRKGSYIPELELVAEEDGVLIGHIMLTGASIRENGGCFGTLLLAPLSVARQGHRSGPHPRSPRQGRRTGAFFRRAHRRSRLLWPIRIPFRRFHLLPRRSRRIHARLRAHARCVAQHFRSHFPSRLLNQKEKRHA